MTTPAHIRDLASQLELISDELSEVLAEVNHHAQGVAVPHEGVIMRIEDLQLLRKRLQEDVIFQARILDERLQALMLTPLDTDPVPVEKDVHTEHCCFAHGCKYGDQDCPVARGRKPASYPCEHCAADATLPDTVREMLE